MERPLPEDEILEILYIDPDEKSQKKTTALLRQWFGDYISFQYCKTLEEGMQALDSGRFDALITEVVFPEIDDPTQVIDRITENPVATDIPVVIYTDYNDLMLSTYAYRMGINELFIKKNLNHTHFEYRLRNLFRMEFRTKLIYRQIDDSLKRFQETHGMSQAEIQDLNSIVAQMRKELEKEYENKMHLEAERNKIQNVFGMYVDPSIIEGIMNNEISLEQKGQQMDVSVLFADIRSYTSLSEEQSPESVVSFLNEYFTSMSEVILGYNGMIDKYIGDAIMCLFGAPVPQDDHRDQAIMAAMEMQSIFQLWGDNWQRAYGFRPSMGIGVASGIVTVGNFGSFQKLSYTAIGDTVNLAARLEGLAKPGEVLVSATLYDHLQSETKERYDYIELEPTTIKGKSERQQVFRVEEKS